MRVTAWLRRDRTIALSGVALAGQSLLFFADMLWAFGAFGPSRPPVAADFPSFYAAGTLTLGGMPELAYDQMAHWYAEQAVSGPDDPYIYFWYPPAFLPICAALAKLPYMAAFVVFEAATLALCVLVSVRIAAIGGWSWILPALAFPPVLWCLGLGQNAFLTAALFGAGTLSVDSRPVRAGVLFGLLCYKPHFAVLVPVALAAGGHARGLLAFAATVCLIAAGTVWLLGVEPWLRYLDALAAAAHVFGSGEILLAGSITPFGAARLIGWPIGVAMGVQGGASLIAAATVAWFWNRRSALPVRAASLIAGTLLSVPMALLYDLMGIGVCVAWLVRAGREGGFLPREKLLLAKVYLIALVSLPAGVAFHLPLGPLAPAIVLGLCVRRAAAATRG